jgi:hypothetical protein
MVIGLASRQLELIILIDEPNTVQPPFISLPFPEHQEPDVRKDMTPPSTDSDIESPARDKILTKSWQDDVHLDHLESTEKKAVFDMLEPHYPMWDGHLGTVKATSHRIEILRGAKPIHSQPYRAGHRARAAEKEEIAKMVAQGVIEPATCEWASPIVLVPKPDGSLRVCVDYRKLNAITVPDTYPLPRMD